MSFAAELILQVEREFLELKKGYVLFFGEQVKVEPHELRDQIMRNVKVLRNSSNLRTEEQFRMNNLIGKIQSHLQLWERQLERRCRGTGRRTAPKKVASASTSQPGQAKSKKVMISNVASQREKVVELYDEYMRLNMMLDTGKSINFAKFQNFINSQTKKVQTVRNDAKVLYEVMVQDQKVVIKSKSVKKD